jgi:hypothetical protein
MAPFQPSFLNILKNFLQFSHLETSFIFSGQALGDLVPFSVNFLLESDPHLWIIVKTACIVNFIILALTLVTLSWAYNAVPKRRDRAAGLDTTVASSAIEDGPATSTNDTLPTATEQN